MSKPIADYAIIGDTHSCALVAKDGGIDWLCWPRHDSPAFFTRLLDEPEGGCATFHIDDGAPTGRHYQGDTAILETHFEASTGHADLIDFMPVHPPSTRTDTGPDGDAQSRIVRLAVCTEGSVDIHFALRVTPDSGSTVAMPFHNSDGWYVPYGGFTLRVTSSHAMICEGEWLRFNARLKNGERAFLAITLAVEHEVPAAETLDDAFALLDRTQNYWSAWCKGIHYDGNVRDAIMRSAITLKLLTYSPTGAIIAAATTSLPEAVPGNRNFDYRYSWVRDASFTVTAFCNLGLVREASEYIRFLREADGDSAKHLKLLFGIDGPVPEEQELSHLPGWNGVGPVRIGNAANVQQQHDIYGEFMIALHAYLDAVDYDPPATFRDGMNELVRILAGHAIRCRHEPDRGIWELRSGAQHLQHSKALLWVTLDRAVKTAERMGGFTDHEIAHWRAEANDLHEEFERETWSETHGAYMQAYGSNVLDAAVLRTVLFGALDATATRVASTLNAIEHKLCDGDLIYRYRMDDGFEGKEATFTACAFWRVGVMALAGRTDEARHIFERLLSRANDVGLFAEEIDAATGEHRGNFPQGFTHMCVINHAVRLDCALQEKGEALQTPPAKSLP